MTPRLQNCVVAHSAINTFIFLKKLRKKIIFCSKQHIGKAINSSKPLIKKNSQTFPKMWDDHYGKMTDQWITRESMSATKNVFLEILILTLFCDFWWLYVLSSNLTPLVKVLDFYLRAHFFNILKDIRFDVEMGTRA